MPRAGIFFSGRSRHIPARGRTYVRSRADISRRPGRNVDSGSTKREKLVKKDYFIMSLYMII